MSSGGIFVSDNKKSIPFRIEFLNIIISKNNCKKVGIILDRIVEIQESDLSSSEEAVFFLSFRFLQTDLFLELGIMNDFVQFVQMFQEVSRPDKVGQLFMTQGSTCPLVRQSSRPAPRSLENPCLQLIARILTRRSPHL